MKKILGIVAALCCLFCLASCQSEDNSLTFSPSSVTIKVGETTSVSVIVKTDFGGTENCTFSVSPSGIAGFPADQPYSGALQIVGIAPGTATVTGYVDSDPSVKGTMTVTVTE